MVLTRSAAKKLAVPQPQPQPQPSLAEVTRKACDEVGINCHWVEENGSLRLVAEDTTTEAQLEYRKRQQEEHFTKVFLRNFQDFRHEYELDVLWEEDVLLGQLDEFNVEQLLTDTASEPSSSYFKPIIRPGTTIKQIQPWPADGKPRGLTGQKTEVIL